MRQILPTLLFSMILAVSTASCKKGGITYDFEGRITESHTGASLAGVEVEISQVLFSTSVANYNYQLAGSATSDANGDWAIAFERQKVTDFRIQMKKDGYFDEIYEFTSAGVSVEDVNTYTTVMDAEAWVEFDIKNVGPLSGDAMTMVLVNFREGCDGCGSNGFYYFGEVVDTTLVFKTTAGVYTRFQFNDETVASLVNDSVMTVPFDTVTYQYHY